MAGEGKLADVVAGTARDAGFADRVIMAGYRDDVPALMHALDVLVLPSIVEGFGYVLVEAMAAGKPVVATRASSIPEIVRDGETGLLVDTHAPEMLAGALIEMLDDPGRARAMGQRGREVMLETFTLEKMIDRTEAAFRSQVARKRRT
jgi:glycosyltransferase involved in cell wall biosynthesis